MKSSYGIQPPIPPRAKGVIVGEINVIFMENQQ